MKLTECAGLMMTLAVLATPVVGEPLSMTIRVLDQANLSSNTIHKMEKYVENTFASVDIDVKWVECASNVERCKSLRGPNEFWLRILGETPATAGTEQVGFTQPGEPGGRGIQCVNVIYPIVQKLVQHRNIEGYQILGAAVAHEIGHLYLGTNDQAHSRTGVMCGFWSEREVEQASIGELSFSREQGAHIRAAMSATAGI
jgi:hypothetical protein